VSKKKEYIRPRRLVRSNVPSSDRTIFQRQTVTKYLEPRKTKQANYRSPLHFFQCERDEAVRSAAERRESKLCTATYKLVLATWPGAEMDLRFGE
jgi:hypothetical protein